MIRIKPTTILSFCLFFLTCLMSNAQVGIGTTSPNASSILELSSANQGFLLPRISLTSSTDVTTIASPVEGLMIYNLGSACTMPSGLYVFDGTSWNKLYSGRSKFYSRLIRDEIGVANVVFTAYSGSNSFGNYASLFNDVDDTNTATFHLDRAGTPAGDWGFGIALGRSYFISELILDGRNDCCVGRLENVVARLYSCGALVYTSAPIAASVAGDNVISIPNVFCDEIRLVVPSGGTTGSGNTIISLSELDVLGFE